MFSELMALIQHRPLTLTIVAVDEKQIRVNVIPPKARRTKLRTEKLGTAQQGSNAHPGEYHRRLNHTLNNGVKLILAQGLQSNKCVTRMSPPIQNSPCRRGRPSPVNGTMEYTFTRLVGVKG